MQRAQRKPGFTLWELLVGVSGVGCAGILLALAVGVGIYLFTR